jgi:Amt family ammonium transporter
VAEFVEDEATLERLRALGVDYAQGYFIAKPEALIKTVAPEHAVLESV